MTDSVSVLVVDDDEMSREMLSVMLDGLATTVMAADGREALDILEVNQEVDLIILDMEMPVMNGVATLTALKAHDVLREIPVLVLSSNDAEVTRMLRLGANDYISKPCDVEELHLRVMNHVRAKKLFDMSKDLNKVLEMEVARKTAALREALCLAREAEYEIVLRLGRAAEFRDLETGMHTKRISEMAKALAQEAGLSDDECEVLRYAAPLHDVGKVGIPDSILLKPGKLTDEEMAVMRLHTVIGGKILADANRYSSLDMGGIIAIQHHEKWDGTGYPRGLKGEEIHVFARIVTVVDIFDALCSERPYKAAMPVAQALGIMREEREKFFDPFLFDIFSREIRTFVAIREKFYDKAVDNELKYTDLDSHPE